MADTRIPEGKVPSLGQSAEKTALEVLSEVLEREHSALMARDAQAIALIAKEKRSLLDQLAIYARARLARGPRQKLAVDIEIRAAWKHVDAQNRINAAVLKLHAESVSRGLSVLRHAVGSDAPYTARGTLSGHYLVTD